MTSQNDRKNFLQVTVFWGGAELGSYSRPLSRARGVSAGKSWFSNIRSVVWPRWDQLEIIQNTKSGLILNPNVAWNGVIANSRGSYVLQAAKPSRKIFEIGPGTTASLRIEELSIAIRVGPLLRKSEKRLKPARGYLGSPLSLVADRKVEWTALAVAFFAAGVIALSARSTLKSRDNDLYSGLSELPDVNLLPFISTKHLADGPTVVQFSLDRFDYVHDIWRYYSEFSKTLGYGEAVAENPKLFPSVTLEYKNHFDDQAKKIHAAEAKQSLDAQSARAGRGLISMPTVSGESVDGKVLRLLDKISVIAASSKDLERSRVSVSETFEKDMGLVKEEKEEKPTNEAFEKIAQGYLGIESDDKMQESLAKSSAAKAALAQLDLFGDERLLFGPINCCDPPAGSPIYQAGLTWIADGGRRDREPTTIASLKASTWGSPAVDDTKIVEPLAGKIEPSLVEKTITAGRYQLRLCYELALRRNQALRGSMEWRWQINTQGQISNLDLLQTSIKDDELVRCVYNKIANWKFPKPKGGSVEVRYPFEFSRDKG